MQAQVSRRAPDPRRSIRNRLVGFSPPKMTCSPTPSQTAVPPADLVERREQTCFSNRPTGLAPSVILQPDDYASVHRYSSSIVRVSSSSLSLQLPERLL